MKPICDSFLRTIARRREWPGADPLIVSEHSWGPFQSLCEMWYVPTLSACLALSNARQIKSYTMRELKLNVVERTAHLFSFERDFISRFLRLQVGALCSVFCVCHSALSLVLELFVLIVVAFFHRLRLDPFWQWHIFSANFTRNFIFKRSENKNCFDNNWNGSGRISPKDFSARTIVLRIHPKWWLPRGEVGAGNYSSCSFRPNAFDRRELSSHWICQEAPAERREEFQAKKKRRIGCKVIQTATENWWWQIMTRKIWKTLLEQRVKWNRKNRKCLADSSLSSTNAKLFIAGSFASGKFITLSGFPSRILLSKWSHLSLFAGLFNRNRGKKNVLSWWLALVRSLWTQTNRRWLKYVLVILHKSDKYFHRGNVDAE